jgi:hypothetical protein
MAAKRPFPGSEICKIWGQKFLKLGDRDAGGILSSYNLSGRSMAAMEQRRSRSDSEKARSEMHRNGITESDLFKAIRNMLRF